MILKMKHLLSATAALILSLIPLTECLAIVPLAHFGKNTVKLEVADTREKIERGLMFRRSLPEDNGMVFIFHPSSAVRFWMFNCFISMDMIFINNGRIVKISSEVPPCKETNPELCPLYPAEGTVTVTEVVEVSSGYCKRHNIKEGDAVTFEFLEAALQKPSSTTDNTNTKQPK